MAKVWMPDYPPASAGTYDDEFDNASLDAAWTEWDVGSKLTVSEETYGLSLLHATTTDAGLAGVFRTAPNNDYTIWTKLSFAGLRGANMVFDGGIVLGQDLANNPSTSDVVVLKAGYSSYSSGDYIAAWKNNDYKSDTTQYGSTLADVVIGAGIYLRVRRASNVLYFDYSTNGIGWQQVATNAEPFVPAQFGVFSQNYATGVNCRVVCSFFRYVGATPALTDVQNGKRVM